MCFQFILRQVTERGDVQMAWSRLSARARKLVEGCQEAACDRCMLLSSLVDAALTDEVLDIAFALADPAEAALHLRTAVRWRLLTDDASSHNLFQTAPWLGRPPSSPLELALASTVIIERSLRNACSVKEHLMKDVIQRAHAEQHITPPMFALLWLLMGPPTTLNLRNLLWHGFVTPHDAAACHDLAVLAAAIALKLHHTLSSSGQEDEEHQQDHAPNSGHARLRDTCKVWARATAEAHHVEIEQCDEEEEGQQAGGWLRAAVEFVRLEGSAREQYGRVNSLEDAALCADSSEYFVTLKEMFAAKTAQGAPNLFFETSQGLIECLYDLTVAPNVRPSLSLALSLLSFYLCASLFHLPHPTCVPRGPVCATSSRTANVSTCPLQSSPRFAACRRPCAPMWQLKR